jgi:hypothetical protein
MSDTKTKLAIEAAGLARSVAHLEATLGEAKAKYWEVVAEIHSFEDDRDYLADGGESLAEMAERYLDDGNFTVAKGAVTDDDT